MTMFFGMPPMPVSLTFGMKSSGYEARVFSV
jgi:hypothetical protein